MSGCWGREFGNGVPQASCDGRTVVVGDIDGLRVMLRRKRGSRRGKPSVRCIVVGIDECPMARATARL